MDPNHDNEHFALIQTGPPVPVDEVEQAGTSTLEVVVCWGENVLHVAHVGTVRGRDGGFTVGEAADFAMSAETLGRDRLPVVLAGASRRVVVPEGAVVELTAAGRLTPHAELEAQGKLEPCDEVAGARALRLPDEAKVRVELSSGIAFHVSATPAARRIAAVGLPVLRPRDLTVTAISLLGHGAFLFLLYFMAPTPSSLAADQVHTDSRIVRYMLEPAAVQQIDTPELAALPGVNQASGRAGRAEEGESGEMGRRDAPRTHNRYGLAGPRDNRDPHMAREELHAAAQQAGIVGLLRQQMGGSANAPTSVYGRTEALGQDPMSALGALLGDQIGDNGGFNGLGLRGTGLHAGGDGRGTIGVDMSGTIGNWGNGQDGPGGNGPGGPRGSWGRVVTDRDRPHASSVPRIRPGTGTAVGSLSREVIRRVVRRNLQQVRYCYETALRTRPDLGGRVVMRWTITSTGSVMGARVASSSLGNAQVEQCIAQRVSRWTFPAPEDGGMVAVSSYPFDLQPADTQ